MRFCEFAPVFFQAMEVFMQHENSVSLRKNKADFFGKQDQQKPDNPSMARHIKEMTGEEISGSTLLQSMYKPLHDFLLGKPEEDEINIRQEKFDILKKYIQVCDMPVAQHGSGPRITHPDGEEYPDELEEFKNTKWYVYSYEEYSKPRSRENGGNQFTVMYGIGRSLLTIGDDFSISIQNFASAEGQKTQNTDYFGKMRVFDKYTLEFDLFSEKGEDKHLHMRMVRTRLPIQDLAVGGYINKGIKCGLLLGNLVFELIPESEGKEPEIEPPRPTFLLADSPDYNQVDDAIIRYLEEKRYSYISVPEAIPDSTELARWLDVKKATSQAYPDRYEGYLKDVFIATPYSTLSKNQRDEVKDAVVEMKTLLKEHHQITGINSGIWGNGEADLFWHKDVIKDHDLIKKLKSSRYFILVYPEPVISSSLIQTGIAMGMKKPTIIFYRDKSHLPQILQKATYVRSFGPAKLIPYREYSDIFSHIRENNSLFTWR